MTYEFKLVQDWEVNEYLQKGWEPVPHTVPVLSYYGSGAVSGSSVFLRRVMNEPSVRSS